MLFQTLSLFILATLVYTPPSFAKDDKDKKGMYVLCKNLKQVRTLRIRDSAADKKICEVVYTKEGISKVEGSGQYYEGCVKILNNIKANLEKGWWKCKDITDTAQIAE
jgi:hypothetical protein